MVTILTYNEGINEELDPRWETGIRLSPEEPKIHFKGAYKKR
jgi:hypothetical protein